MKQKIGVETALACPENVINGRAVFGRVLYGLVERVVFLWRTGSPGQVTIVMRASQKAHAGVLDVSIVDRKPAGDSFARGERPVAGVLMPGNALAIPGHFAEEMGSPAYDIRSQKVLHTGDDFRMGEEIINAAIF